MKAENYDTLVELRNDFELQLRATKDDHALVFIAVKPKEKDEEKYLDVTIISDLKDSDLNMFLNCIAKNNYEEIPQGD